MPEYTYVCTDEHINIEFMRMSQHHPRRIKCKHPGCTKRAGRAYMAPQLNTGFEAYVTEAGDGQKKIIRNANDERDLEKRFDLAFVGDSDMKRMRENMPKQKQRVADRAYAQMKPFHEDYAMCENEVKQYGKDFAKEQSDRESKEAEAFQEVVDAGLAND